MEAHVTSPENTRLRRIKIGKTIYRATEQYHENAGWHWELVAERGPKKPKHLFLSRDGKRWTLWSSHPALRGPGLPKLVDIEVLS